MNKVKYGLKNVHYAIVTETAGVVTYGTPKRIPGAVSLALTPKGEKTEFFADDTSYFIANSNQGYEGTIELALVPDEFKVLVLGWLKDINDVLFEDSNASAKDIALMFEFTGDAKAIRHVFYKVHTARPSVESTTKSQTKEVKTETLNMTASPAMDTGYVKAKSEVGMDPYATWFAQVYTFDALGV